MTTVRGPSRLFTAFSSTFVTIAYNCNIWWKGLSRVKLAAEIMNGITRTEKLELSEGNKVRLSGA